MLSARAVSNAARYRRDGYLRRALGNQARRILHTLHLSPEQARNFHAATTEWRMPPSRRRNFAATFRWLQS